MGSRFAPGPGSLAIFFLLIVVGVFPAHAATYYVDGSTDGCNGAPCSNGNDGLTENTAFGDPYGCLRTCQGGSDAGRGCSKDGHCSSGSCGSAVLGPGDVCLVKDGTYYGALPSGPQVDSQTPTYDLASLNGTAGQPITIKAYPNHRPKLCYDPGKSSCKLYGSDGNNGKIIGTDPDSPSASHIVVEGFDLQGSVSVWGAGTHNHHLRFSGNTIHDGGTGCDGNFSLIWVAAADDTTFDHNDIHTIRRGSCSFGSQDAGIKLWSSNNTVIEYNTIRRGATDNMSFAIEAKFGANQVTVRYNDIERHVRFGKNTTPSSNPHRTGNGKVYGNILRDGYFRTAVENQNWQLYNNTIVDGLFWLDDPGPGNHMTESIRDGSCYNNIVARGANPDSCAGSGGGCNVVTEDGFHETNSAVTSSAISTWRFDYNAYNAGAIYRERAYGGDKVTHSSLNSWRSMLANEAAGARDEHSFESSSHNGAPCQFVDLTGGDLRLVPGDACRAAGCGNWPTCSEGAQVGAYGVTDCVGHNCDQEPDCGDGRDNDGDGLTDYPNDPGCTSAADFSEFGAAACDDGLDNDGDGLVDHRAAQGDPGCASLTDGDENNCGNAVLEPGEQCEGSNLGSATCVSEGFTGGDLACSGTCTFDTSACHAEPVADECASPAPEWLLCDGFESGDLGYWNDDLNTDGDRFSVSAELPFSGGYAARYTHVSGGAGNGWGAKFIADHPLLSSPGPELEELYLRTRVRLDPQFQWVSGGSQKLHIIAAFEGWGAYPGTVNSWAAYYVILELDENGRPTLTLNRKDGGNNWRGIDQNIGGAVSLSKGAWQEIQVRIKLNDPGLSNGIAQMWVNGVLKLNRSDVDYRGDYDQHGWNHVMLSSSSAPASPAAQWLEWDTVVVADDFIDLPSGGGGAPLPVISNLWRTDVYPGQ